MNSNYFISNCLMSNFVKILRKVCLFSLKKLLVHEVKNVGNLIFRYLTREWSMHKIDDTTVMNGWIMGYLHNNADKEVCQKDFEDEFKITKSTVTSMLKSMEKKGYIERKSVDYDARKKIITLTPEGEEIHSEIVEVFKETEEYLKKDISPEELEVFFTVIDKIKKNVESSGIKPIFPNDEECRKSRKGGETND